MQPLQGNADPGGDGIRNLLVQAEKPLRATPV
jgi:hypothetical protein